MSLTLHNIPSSEGTKKTKKRIGRGGKRGTYSGKGLKGQRARSGGKRGLKRLGLKPLMTQTHKKRGFKSPHTKPEIVGIGRLNIFTDGDIITPQILKKRGLISTTRNGVKILANGTLNKEIKISGCEMSETVKEMLKK